MSEWSLYFIKDAENDFKKLDRAHRAVIVKKLEWLAEHFDAITHTPLAGSWQGFFKLRVGNWRVIYKVNYKELLLTVYVIDQRDKVYKRSP